MCIFLFLYSYLPQTPKRSAKGKAMGCGNSSPVEPAPPEEPEPPAVKSRSDDKKAGRTRWGSDLLWCVDLEYMLMGRPAFRLVHMCTCHMHIYRHRCSPCTYMYVYIYIDIDINTYICKYACAHCQQTYITHTFIHAYMHTYTHECIGGGC